MRFSSRLTPAVALLAAAWTGSAGCDSSTEPPADQAAVSLRPPRWIPKPPLSDSGPQAEAAFDLQVMYLEGVLGRPVPTPTDRDRARWRQAILAEYPSLPADVRDELARASKTLSALCVAWGQLPPTERDRIRAESLAAGGWQPAEAVMARQFPDGLRIEQFKVALRTWPEFLRRVRTIPGVTAVEARAVAGPLHSVELEYTASDIEETPAVEIHSRVVMPVTAVE